MHSYFDRSFEAEEVYAGVDLAIVTIKDLSTIIAINYYHPNVLATEYYDSHDWASYIIGVDTHPLAPSKHILNGTANDMVLVKHAHFDSMMVAG